MPSETDLLNDAIGQIGASRITAIDDGSTNATHCQTFYPTLRDAELTAVHWTWAKRRVELAEDADGPPFEFTFSYTLPADCLKLIEYNGAATDLTNIIGFEGRVPARWKVEGNKVLTNDGTVKIVYLARITDPNKWTPYFYQGVAAKLAGKLASAIMKDSRMALAKLEEGQYLISLAAAIDSQQSSIEPFIVDGLLWGR